MDNNEFWDRIKTDFDLSEMIVDDLRAITEKDKRHIDFIRKYYDLPGNDPTRRERNYGRLLFPMPFGSDSYEIYLDAAKILGLPLVKPASLNFQRETTDIVSTIKQAIESKQCTPEFITAWGHYNRAIGVIIHLQSSDLGEVNFVKYNLDGKPGNVIEEEIIARWFAKTYNPGKSKEDCLADLLTEIETFLNSEKSERCAEPILKALRNLYGEGEIKGRGKNIPVSVLKEIAMSPLIPDKDLPSFLN